MNTHRQHFMDANPTTRRHPRSLNDAFPTGAAYGAALERRAPEFWTPVRVLFALTYVAAFIVLWWVL